MSGLISKISIKSYRGIDNLELNDLRQINILTGDNNSGKTSILEVINIFGQPDLFRSWVNASREERPLAPSGISLYERVNDFFNVNCMKKKVEFMIETEAENIEIEMAAEDSEIQMTQKAYYNKLGYYLLSESGEPELGGDNLIDVPITFFNMKVFSETEI